MTTLTTTRNLKLRVSSDMSSDTKYNLYRLDTVASAVLVDTLNDVRIRSINDIHLLPESNDIGGGGTGGSIFLGSPDQPLTQLAIFAELVLAPSVGLRDTAPGGTKSLSLVYNSTLSGTVDTNSDRTLSFDLQAADRSLVLGGDTTITGGNLTLSLGGATTLVLPTAGTLATIAGAETLTNKIISPLQNTILGLADRNIASNAGILGSKIVSNFGNQPIITSQTVEWTDGTYSSSIKKASSGQNSDVEWELPPADGTLGQILSTDGDGKLVWTDSTAGSLSGLDDVDVTGVVAGEFLQFDGVRWVPGAAGGGGGFVATWLAADGSSTILTHSLNSLNVTVEIFDESQNTIEIDTVNRSSANTITLTASQAPTVAWTVLITRIS